MTARVVFLADIPVFSVMLCRHSLAKCHCLRLCLQTTCNAKLQSDCQHAGESGGIWNMYERTTYEVGNVLPMSSLRARVGAESSFFSPCQHFGQGSRFCHIGWCCHGDEARLADSRLYLAAQTKMPLRTSILSCCRPSEKAKEHW
jgi:hypothetical protein